MNMKLNLFLNLLILQKTCREGWNSAADARKSLRLHFVEKPRPHEIDFNSNRNHCVLEDEQEMKGRNQKLIQKQCMRRVQGQRQRQWWEKGWRSKGNADKSKSLVKSMAKKAWIITKNWSRFELWKWKSNNIVYGWLKLARFYLTGPVTGCLNG